MWGLIKLCPMGCEDKGWTELHWVPQLRAGGCRRFLYRRPWKRCDFPAHPPGCLVRKKPSPRSRIRPRDVSADQLGLLPGHRTGHPHLDRGNVAWLATVKQLHSRLLQFQGGNCRIESYEPRFVETSVTSLLWKVLSCAWSFRESGDKEQPKGSGKCD